MKPYVKQLVMVVDSSKYDLWHTSCSHSHRNYKSWLLNYERWVYEFFVG